MWLLKYVFGAYTIRTASFGHKLTVVAFSSNQISTSVPRIPVRVTRTLSVQTVMVLIVVLVNRDLMEMVQLAKVLICENVFKDYFFYS